MAISLTYQLRHQKGPYRLRPIALKAKSIIYSFPARSTQHVSQPKTG